MSFVDTSTSTSRWVSLTPLIDVVFILIMFFMLTTQFDRTQMLELIVSSENQTPAQVLSNDDIARVIVTKEGVWQFDEKQHSVSDTSAMSELANFDSVLITADDEVVLQDVIKLIDALANAGVDQVSWVPAANADAR